MEAKLSDGAVPTREKLLGHRPHPIQQRGIAVNEVTNGRNVPPGYNQHMLFRRLLHWAECYHQVVLEQERLLLRLGDELAEDATLHSTAGIPLDPAGCDRLIRGRAWQKPRPKRR